MRNEERIMLTILLGTDWKVNRDTVLQKISQDVALQKSGTILMVPELVSHQTERELCMYAGHTAAVLQKCCLLHGWQSGSRRKPGIK